MWAPLGPLPGSLVPALMNSGVFESSTATSAGLDSQAAGGAEDPLVAIARHGVEHFDLALEDLVVGREHVLLVDRHPRRVDVARIRADEREERAVTEGREGVGGAVAVEPGEVPIRDRPLQRRDVRRRIGVRRRPEQLAVDDLREAPVALFVQVYAVYGQRRPGALEQSFGRGKQVDERHAARRRHLGHGRGIALETHIVLAAVRQIRVAEILVRDRREQHDARRRTAVVLLGQGVRDPLVQLLPERRQARVAAIGLVVAEEREDHVRLRVRAAEAILLIPADRLGVGAQPLVGRAEVLRPQALRNLVAGEAEIPHHEIVLGEARVQQRVQPALILHPLGELVADGANVITRL